MLEFMRNVSNKNFKLLFLLQTLILGKIHSSYSYRSVGYWAARPIPTASPSAWLRAELTHWNVDFISKDLNIFIFRVGFFERFFHGFSLTCWHLEHSWLSFTRISLKIDLYKFQISQPSHPIKYKRYYSSTLECCAVLSFATIQCVSCMFSP